jgi:prolyl-tRNA synthetase
MSRLAVRTTKHAPKDATTINHQLLVRAGFVRQLMAGVFSYLPFGLRTLNKVRNVIREEMDAIGGQELQLPALHPAANWKKTGGWDSIDVLFKVKSRTGKDYALGQSHEEVITPLAAEFIESYKDLPLALYQIQWKFRDELRAKSGILRGREFEMKDMYSFHETQEDFERYYGEVKAAYVRAYNRLGLTAKVTEASGGGFSEKISYEFMVLTDAGEDDILYCPSCEFCVNEEIAKQKKGGACPKCTAQLKSARASEVGNVFDLGDKYGKDFDVKFKTRDGKSMHPIMGCYGWGTTRTMGVIVERFHDDRGIMWPASIAPYNVHLVSLKGGEAQAQKAFDALTTAGIDVLWDDRDGVSAGAKFADADLIGIPWRLVASKKTGDKYELKRRDTEATVEKTLAELKTYVETGA